MEFIDYNNSDITNNIIQPVNNLLINGDFQVNQRGKSEYNENKDGSYTLDMWRTRQGNYTNAIKIKPRNGGGVTITLPSLNIGAGINQLLPMDDSNLGKQFTAIVSKDGKVYHYTTTLSTTDEGIFIEKGIKLDIMYNNTDKYLRFSLYFQNDTSNPIQNKPFDIDYCYLYEGTEIYPYQKEHYPIALTRCAYYYQYIGLRVIALTKTWGELRNSMLIGTIPILKIKNSPSIVLNPSNVYSDSSTTGNDFSMDKVNISKEIRGSSIYIIITKKDGSTFDRNYEYFLSISDPISISAEPY